MRTDVGSATDIEWEANDFASELLMPTRQFGIDMAKRDLSVATARALAGMDFYDVSVTSAAWRMVQLSKDPCALVMSSGGTIEWATRSLAMRIPGLRRGTSVNSDSLARAGLQSGTSEIHPQEVEISTWLEPRYALRGKLLESTHVIRSTGQVLSLLWLVDTDDVVDFA